MKHIKKYNESASKENDQLVSKIKSTIENCKDIKQMK